MEYGLIGKVLVHSYSQYIHTLLTQKEYVLKSLDENEFINFMKNKDFKGINVTIPYKEKVIPYLDEIDEKASLIGAVNTIINQNNHLKGYNTDYYGFIKMIKRHNINFENKKVLILGSGGTSKTIKQALIDLSAKEIYIVSRTKKKNVITYQELDKYFDIDCIINTTPYGMYPNYEKDTLIDVKKFPYLSLCIDIIYNPYKTNFLLEAKKRNIKIISGLEMLVEQAILASELFFNVKYSEIVYKNIFHQTMLKYNNIVLIGMPASGKTTASRILSKKLKMEYLDLDEEFEKINNVSIKEYFEKYSESAFREQENQIVKSIKDVRGKIISTGGGTFLNEENAEILSRNGIVIFLNRDLYSIKKIKSLKKTRPLLVDDNALQDLYEKRIEIYKKYSDKEIYCKGTKLNTINLILESLR